jgi:hypothetical protein
MNRFPRPAKRKPRTRSTMRQASVVLAIGASVTLGAVAIEQFVMAKHKSAAMVAGFSDDEIYTGSILYTPDSGSICRQLLFDNRNGQFYDNGSVDCARAAYHSTAEPPKQWSVARVRVISTGFVRGD